MLPVVCVACDQLTGAGEGERDLVCARCWSRVRLLPHPRCERCGHPKTDETCAWCGLLPQFVRACRSVCWVSDGSGGAIVHALKYGGWRKVAEPMGERMARTDWPADVMVERAALIPVPLARDRRRERGYNQSELLARVIARSWSVPVWTDVLERRRKTRTQTRLTPGERLANVAGAFSVAAGGGSRLRGAHVVLVDDVVTTAATLNSCAGALYDAGARIISYVTFGRARSGSDAV
ncbi:MAG: phosphoribosyltransferase family protein [Gemmatimonadaceae bacterium]|nr:phosphoribosyltransferase family protein [Gemmatimonadaceae bacterium]